MVAMMFVLGLFILSGCGSTADKNMGSGTKEKKLVVGTNATYVPFEFKDESTQDYSGYDIDLINAIAKEMHATVEWRNVSFDALIPALMSKDIDIAASGMTITKVRAEKVAFSAPYYESGLGFLVKNGIDAGPNGANLLSHPVSVQVGTTGATLAEKLKFQSIKSFDHSNEAILEMTIGGADAAILDLPVAQYYVSKHPDAHFTVVPYVSSDKEYFGFAMNKDNKELKTDVDAAIAKLKQSGELNKLYQKWFHQDAPDMPLEVTFK